MGFFSWNCKGCGQSMKSRWAINSDDPDWLKTHTQVVVLLPNGTILRGEYDGYGRVDDMEIPFDLGENDPDCWHEKCWKEAESPTEYSGPSEHSRDQGYFFTVDKEKEECHGVF